MAGILARIGHETKSLATAFKSAPFSAFGGSYGSYGNYGGGIYGGFGGVGGFGGIGWHLPGSQYDDVAAAGVLWENPSAAACFVALTKAFAQARPFLEKRVKPDGDEWERENHRIIELIERPNAFYSGEKMFGVTLIASMAQGSAFWRFERDRKGDVSEIWYEPPVGTGASGIVPRWDAQHFIKDYVHVVDGKPNLDNPLSCEDVVFFRHGLNVANPRLPWAPLGLGSREIAVLNGASTYTAAVLRNHGAPAGFVSLDGGGRENATPPTPEQATSLKEHIEAKFGGPQNAGKTFVSPLPWKWNRVGMTPAELVIDKIRQWPQETICALLGTPVIVALLPTGEQPTYQNLEASMKWWWDNTIMPLEDAFADEIETQMFPAFGLDSAEYRIAWDRSKVAALQDDEAAKLSMWNAVFSSGGIDRYTLKTKINIEADEAKDRDVYAKPPADAGGDAGAADASTPVAAKAAWNESEHPRADDGEFSSGREIHLATVKDYQSGAARGTTPAPNGKHSDWTPETGGMVFHGTTKAFTKFSSREAYLTDDYDEAKGYAKGVHLGGGTGKKPMVRTLVAKPGKTMDANGVLAAAMEEGEDFDDALNKAFVWARDRGARYVVFDHPGNAGRETEQRAIVALHPNEDLKFTGGWAIADEKKSISAMWISEMEIVAGETKSLTDAEIEAKRFDPNQPRDEDGKWAAGGSSGATSTAARKGVMRPATTDEKKALGIPPAYTDVLITDDKSAELKATAKSGKGKVQYYYTPEYSQRQAAAKFDRVKEIHNALPAMRATWDKEIASGGKNTPEAMALRLIAQTGFRVGGLDGGGDAAAYGASSLLASHAKVTGDKVDFDFIGKGGHRQQHSLRDAVLARHIEARQKAGKDTVFDTDDGKVREYLKRSGGNFKVHDLRTRTASALAAHYVGSAEKRGLPESAKDRAALKNAIADKVARKLGDTRSVVLSSYISPTIWQGLDA